MTWDQGHPYCRECEKFVTAAESKFCPVEDCHVRGIIDALFRGAVQDPRLDALIELADERDWTVADLVAAVLKAAWRADLDGGKYRKIAS